MVTTRQEVYAALDSERSYQQNLRRKGILTDGAVGKIHTPMEHLATLRTIIRQMEDAFYSYSGSAVPEGKTAMDFMRKIGATAVRAMEQHGAPLREGF